MADRLQYNVDDLRAQAKKMREIARNLEEASDNLSSQLDVLKRDWVSDASTKFFNSIDGDWKTAVAHYVELLRELAKQLTFAANTYEPLVDEYRSISLD
ncbi:WXG100 family type VII secretion target [Thermophilibacter sp.]